jgi:hypothetical protein
MVSVRLLNALGPLITALATIAIAGYTWALRDSTSQLWKAGERHFELEGPSLHPIIQHHSAIAEGLRVFSIYDHPTSAVGPVASGASFTIRNVGRSPALLKSVAAKLDHWIEMVEELRVDFLARYDVEPVVEPGDETKQVFTETVTIPIDRAAFESLTSGNSHLFLYGRSLFLTSSARTTSRPSASPTTSTPSDLSAGQAATTNVPAPPRQGRGDRQGPSEGHAPSMASILPAFASPRVDQRHDGVADQRKGHDDHGGFDGVRTCHASPVCCKAAVLLSHFPTAQGSPRAGLSRRDGCHTPARAAGKPLASASSYNV